MGARGWASNHRLIMLFLVVLTGNSVLEPWCSSEPTHQQNRDANRAARLGTITCLPAPFAWCGISWVCMVHHQILNGKRLGEIASNTTMLDASLAAITLDADRREDDDVTHLQFLPRIDHAGTLPLFRH